jgi:diguanylate cyclase (GGDEF)-like protein
MNKGQKGVYVFFFFLISIFIGILDYKTGYRMSFFIFYLLPVAACVWLVGRAWALAFSVFCAVIWAFAEVSSRNFDFNVFFILWNASVRGGYFIVLTLALSKIKILLEQERRKSRSDYITNLANSYAFTERLNLEINRARRFKRPLSVAYIDCDNFKAINDTLGHNTGNEALRKIGAVLSNNVRSIDLAARMGGDEFAVLLPETDFDSTETVLMRLRQMLSESMKENNWPVSFSIGLITYVEPPLSADAIIKKADELMYSAKRSGKNMINRELLDK